MRPADFIHLGLRAVRAHRLRSALTMLGIAIGIAAVVLLTSIGAGIHRFVLAEFTQFGTNLIGIQPGRTSTHGASVGAFGSVRPLTIEDAEALRRAPHVQATVPLVQGNAAVEFGQRSRRVTVYGVGSDFDVALSLNPHIGRFLPPDDPGAARAFAVLGSKLRNELFSADNPLGSRIRVGGRRYTVIGVMEPKGQVLGFDLDDTVFIPAGRALEMFNRESLMEVDVLFTPGADDNEVAAGIRKLLTARHGSEDFTITTQQQMLDVLGSVLSVLTFAVGALGGISLLVGGVGILTIMTIAVRERTAEIGLLRALGAPRGQILGLFLGEATLLSVLGGMAGLLLVVVLIGILHLLLPGLPVYTPVSYVILAIVLAGVIGLSAGVLPARYASRLDPVEALRAE
jgi:putative ABC transport system permease protein